MEIKDDVIYEVFNEKKKSVAHIKGDTLKNMLEWVRLNKVMEDIMIWGSSASSTG